jgi:hypothetical protein
MTKISEIEGRGRNSFLKQLIVGGPRRFRRISYQATMQARDFWET